MRPATASRSRTVLLVSITIGAVGTGLFLPIELLYLIRVIGLPVATAGLTITAATTLALVLPALTGAMVDRFGSWRTFLLARCAQVLGAASLLFVQELIGAFLATLLVAAGMRMFWSSVFAVVSDVVTDQSTSDKLDEQKERGFALTGMAESAGVAAGGFLAALAMIDGSAERYWWLIAANTAVFAISALLVSFGVRAPRRMAVQQAATGYRDVLAHRSFLAFVLASIPPTLSLALFARVLPVYAVTWLDVPGWVPGALLGWVTVVAAVGRGWVVRLALRLSRRRALLLSIAAFTAWTLGIGVAWWLPQSILIGYLFALTVPFLAAELLYGPIANAVVEAVAPQGLRGRYLATFQYTFGASDALAPALVAMLVLHPALPWLSATLALLVAWSLMPLVLRRFPARALRLQPSTG